MFSPNQNEAQIENTSCCCFVCTVIDAKTCASTQMRRYYKKSDDFQKKVDLMVNFNFVMCFVSWGICSWYVRPTPTRIVESDGVAENVSIWLIQMLLCVTAWMWSQILSAFLGISVWRICALFLCFLIFVQESKIIKGVRF